MHTYLHIQILAYTLNKEITLSPNAKPNNFTYFCRPLFITAAQTPRIQTDKLYSCYF